MGYTLNHKLVVFCLLVLLTVSGLSLTDFDGDGLRNVNEIFKGTNLFDKDTDLDGYGDGMEVGYLSGFGANPTRKDIFVEVDYVSDGDYPFTLTLPERNPFDEMKDGRFSWWPDAPFDENRLHKSVEEAFAEAPVDNPNGSEGISLHVLVDEKLSGEDIEWNEDNPSVGAFREEHLSGKRENLFFYCVVLPKSDVGWGASYGRSFFVMDGSEDEDFEGLTDRSVFVATFMHELGHSLGLSPTLFEGIDSQKCSAREYISVMSYYLSTDPFLDYSSDEWEYLEQKKLFQ